jgi:hypothetical protein
VLGLLIQALLGNKASGVKPVDRSSQDQKNSSKFLEQEQQQQMMMMKDQDREMEAVASTVVNLKEIATVMGNELDEQSRYYFQKLHKWI